MGADAFWTSRLTAAFGIYVQRLFNAAQLVSSPYTDLGKCSDINCTVLTPGITHPDFAFNNHADINITNASVGLKFRAVGKLVLTGNVLLKLDDGGLRSQAMPSWVFPTASRFLPFFARAIRATRWLFGSAFKGAVNRRVIAMRGCPENLALSYALEPIRFL